MPLRTRHPPPLRRAFDGPRHATAALADAYARLLPQLRRSIPAGRTAARPTTAPTSGRHPQAAGGYQV